MKNQERGWKIPRKGRVFLVAALVLMVAISAGGTLAWLMTSSNSMKNQFVVPVVAPTIREDFEDGGSVKSNVRVENTVAEGKTGIDVFIRVALVPTWETADRENVAPMPTKPDDFNTWNLNLNVTDEKNGKWIQEGEYYYYTGKVVPGATTSNLINTATVNPNSEGAKAGYRMNLQVMAEAIQATELAVKDVVKEGAWPAAVLSQLKF